MTKLTNVGSFVATTSKTATNRGIVTGHTLGKKAIMVMYTSGKAVTLVADSNITIKVVKPNQEDFTTMAVNMPKTTYEKMVSKGGLAAAPDYATAKAKATTATEKEIPVKEQKPAPVKAKKVAAPKAKPAAKAAPNTTEKAVKKTAATKDLEREAIATEKANKKAERLAKAGKKPVTKEKAAPKANKPTVEPENPAWEKFCADVTKLSLEKEPKVSEYNKLVAELAKAGYEPIHRVFGKVEAVKIRPARADVSKLALIYNQEGSQKVGGNIMEKHSRYFTPKAIKK